MSTWTGACAWEHGGTSKPAPRCDHVTHPAPRVRPGDLVTVCTGDTHWTVQAVTPDGIATITNATKWMAGVPYRVHAAHLELAGAPAEPDLLDLLEMTP